MENTHIVRKLTDTERHNIYQDLERVKDCFDLHSPNSKKYMRYGGLRDGQTVWLHGLNGNFLHVDNAKNIINFIDQFAKFSGKQKIGRTYIHKLKPGQQIFKHKDTDEEYFYQIDRYQIILDLPETVYIKQKGSSVSEFSLIYFNHLIQHAYSNDSDKDWYLIVFDLYKI
jgi:hypothetical protein